MGRDHVANGGGELTIVYGLLRRVQRETGASDGGGVRLQSYIRPVLWSAQASGP